MEELGPFVTLNFLELAAQAPPAICSSTHQFTHQISPQPLLHA